jgi:hypothetical protein
MTMDAFGIIAPDSSAMVPVIIPVGACARAARPARRASEINTQENALDMETPLKLD